MIDLHNDITVVIPNWNGRKWLPGCLASLTKQTCPPRAVIVVDNGSTDDSCDWLAAHHPTVQVIRMEHNTGFAAAVNAGLRVARTPLVALLNNDTSLAVNWLEALATTLTQNDASVAAVCGKMLQMDHTDRIENAGDTLSWQGAAEKRGHGEPAEAYSATEEIFSVCAGGALYRSAFFDRIGHFDESFFAYLEDIDLGLRGRLYGYRYLYEPAATMLHHGHGSGLPSPVYVRYTTANRLRLFLKNIPARLWMRNFHSWAYGQLYFFICNRRPMASLLGLWDVWVDLPAIFQSRCIILRETVLKPSAIQAMLTRRMNQPGLTHALRNRWMKRQTKTS
jgi:GT2 family glycosyltransferase